MPRNAPKVADDVDIALRRCFFQLDAEAAMDIVTRHACHSLNGNQASVFLRKSAQFTKFVRHSMYTKTWGHFFPPGTSSVVEISDLAPGWPARKPIADLAQKPCFKPKGMMIPILDKVGRMIGFLGVKNKSRAFADQDFNFAKALAEKLQHTLRDIREIEQILTDEKRYENEFTIDIHGILQNVLTMIRDMLRFRRGLIYVYDPINTLLRCGAMLDPPHGIERYALKYETESKLKSLATWSFRHGPAVVPLGVKDGRVNAAGVERLGLTGDLFAYPIRHNKSAVGVMVLSDHEGNLTPNVALKRLGLFSRMAGAAIALHACKKADEAFFHHIVDTLPACVFRKDSKGRFSYANQGFQDDVGESLEKIVGANDYNFYPTGIARAYRRDDRKVMNDGQPISQDEEHYQYRGGPLRYVRVVKGPVWNSRGEIRGVQGVFVDVTANKFKEALFERTTDIIFSHDEKGFILSMNEAGKKLLGIDGRTASSVTIYDKLARDERRPLRELIQDAADAVRKRKDSAGPLLSGAPRLTQPRVLRIRAADRTIRKLQFSSSAISLPDGQIIFHGIARDLTLQERLNTEESQQERNVYLEIQVMLMRHNIGNPIQAILNESRNLAGLCANIAGKFGSESNDLAQAIRGRAEKLGALSTRTRQEFEKLREGKPAMCNLKTLVRGLGIEPGIEFGFAPIWLIDESVPDVQTLEIDLTAALTLVVRNAYEHAQRKSIRIGLSYSSHTDRVHFWVENIGCISNENIRNFRRGIRLSSSNPTAGNQGRGFGLTIARRIVRESLGGQMLLQNLKRGTQRRVRVDIFLPKRRLTPRTNHESKSQKNRHF